MADGAGFCGSCGTHVSGSTSGAPATGGTTGFGSQSAGLTSNVAGALAYLAGFVSGIILLAVDPFKNDPFVRFHAWQSIFLSAAYVVFSIAWGVIFGTLFIVSLGFLWSVIVLISNLIRLAFLALWLLMMYKAYNNERFSLPFIGPLAAQKAGI
jgi:uncharacterized membrane protein